MNEWFASLESARIVVCRSRGCCEICAACSATAAGKRRSSTGDDGKEKSGLMAVAAGPGTCATSECGSTSFTMQGVAGCVINSCGQGMLYSRWSVFSGSTNEQPFSSSVGCHNCALARLNDLFRCVIQCRLIRYPVKRPSPVMTSIPAPRPTARPTIS